MNRFFLQEAAKSAQFKFSRLFLLLLFIALGQGRICAQQIDSIQSNFAPSPGGLTPQTHIGFKLFTSDTVGISGIRVKLGLQSGGSELFNATLPFAGVQVEQSGAIYIPIDIGDLSLIPPYIEAVLIRSDGSQSAAQSKQFVF